MSMPPGTVAVRRAYTGRVISLDVDRVRFPDGTEGELEMVRHPGAAAVLPLLSDPAGSDPIVALIKQYRYATGRFILEVPAGRLDPGEAPDACARRELLEETGMRAGRVEHLTTIYTTPGFTDERIHLFLASALTLEESRREVDEFIEVVRMPMSDAMAAIARGEIVDGKTLVSLMFAAGFRLNR